MGTSAAAVICDIVDSRAHGDRRALHDEVLRALERAHRAVPALVPPYPTVGDEFQAVFATASQAIVATVRCTLALADGIECRFGIGVGVDRAVTADEATVIRDGSAWWRAREAIEEVEDAERSGRRAARTGLRADDASEGLDGRALLILQDHVLGRMQARERRIAAGVLDGMRQAEIASAERISQAAVSKSLRRSGGSALVAAIAELERGSSWSLRS